MITVIMPVFNTKPYLEQTVEKRITSDISGLGTGSCG